MNRREVLTGGAGVSLLFGSGCLSTGEQGSVDIVLLNNRDSSQSVDTDVRDESGDVVFADTILLDPHGNEQMTSVLDGGRYRARITVNDSVTYLVSIRMNDCTTQTLTIPIESRDVSYGLNDC
jgi:hypothetical protein